MTSGSRKGGGEMSGENSKHPHFRGRESIITEGRDRALEGMPRDLSHSQTW